MGTETYFRFRIIFTPTTFAHGDGFDAAAGRDAQGPQEIDLPAIIRAIELRRNSYSVTSSA